MHESDGLYEEVKHALLPFESWERLPGESSAAFGAFCAFRDFGPERNIRKAVDAAFKKEHGETDLRAVEKRYRGWRNWSMQFKWFKRAEDYDCYIDKMKQAELRKTIEEQGKVHREITGKMLTVVTKKLDLMDPEELTQGNITEWVETAIRTEREIAGLTASKDKTERQTGTQGAIRFTPEFEGL
jgi:hypothetical protein